jgi:hypothetical protein
LCICGCNPPPKLIASQNFRYQSLLCIDGDPPGKPPYGGLTILQRRLALMRKVSSKPICARFAS